MSTNTYLVRQINLDFHYLETILFKYHKISETLAQVEPRISYPTFEEECLKLQDSATDGVIKVDTIEGLPINQFVKIDDNDQLQVLQILDLHSMNDIESMAFRTLAYIVYNYIIHDYQYDFSRHRGENMSDKEASDYEDEFIKDAYNTLKDLKNLLLFSEQGYKNNIFTLDKTEDIDIGNGKMKSYIVKENQVEVKDNSLIEKVSQLLIQEKLLYIKTSQNQYLNTLKFQAYTLETLTYDFVNNEYEGIRGMVEKSVKGKTPSKKSVFKGMISKLVKKYVKDEQFTMNEKQVDERQAQLIAYTLLSWFGFISLHLINSHKDRDARIKYMDSLPQWTDDPILPNRMKLISTEEMLKKYSSS